jgi:hypothetical protein
MFSVFLAGAAVLEIHRAIHRPPGDPDVEVIQKREAELKAALEVPARGAPRSCNGTMLAVFDFARHPGHATE